MLRNLLRGIGLACLVFLAGLVLESNAHAQTASVMAKWSAKAGVVKALKVARGLLVRTDYDYHGHRAKAAHKVAQAISRLTGHHHYHGHHHSQTVAHSHERAMHEPQANSDARLRRARQILHTAVTSLGSRHPKATADVRASIVEINKALSIR